MGILFQYTPGYRVHGDLIVIYPKPYSMYLRGAIGLRGQSHTSMMEGLEGLLFAL